jgi:hypothetical protein
MPRPIEDPVTTADDRMSDKEDVTTHPAFGLIGASRVSGSTQLYGSDFTHNAYMTITIRRSNLRRSLSRDWHSGREELIEVALSEAQWATFVSAPNVGEGVPCTLQHVQGKMVPGIPVPQVRSDQFASDMDESLDAVASRIQAVLDRIDSMGLSKKKAEELRMELSVAKSHLKANVAFVAKSFDEHMEETVEKAKAEVHGYMTGVLVRAGLDALPGAQMPLQIEDPKHITS